MFKIRSFTKYLKGITGKKEISFAISTSNFLFIYQSTGDSGYNKKGIYFF